MIEFINLTNGLECNTPDAGPQAHFCRIQSTHCEQKLWNEVICGAGPDLLMHMALGYTVIVHDQSEKDRETRAMWQGLTLVRRTAQALWNLERTPIVGRGGSAMQQYFDVDVIPFLTNRTVSFVKYYRQYLFGKNQPLQVEPCNCWRQEQGSGSRRRGRT